MLGVEVLAAAGGLVITSMSESYFLAADCSKYILTNGTFFFLRIGILPLHHVKVIEKIDEYIQSRLLNH